MQEEKHYINSIYYQFELTAKYCRYLGAQLFKKLGFILSLDEIVNMVKEVINENQRLKDDLSKYSSIKVTDSFSSIEIKLSEFN